MKETTHNVVPAPADSLHAELRALIASSRQRLAGAVNAELTRLYWNVGQRLRTEVLDGADRAKYGDQLINRVGDQLAQEFGRGFDAKNLRRMVQFAQAFPQPEIVATLSPALLAGGKRAEMTIREKTLGFGRFNSLATPSPARPATALFDQATVGPFSCAKYLPISQVNILHLF